MIIPVSLGMIQMPEFVFSFEHFAMRYNGYWRLSRDRLRFVIFKLASPWLNVRFSFIHICVVSIVWIEYGEQRMILRCEIKRKNTGTLFMLIWSWNVVTWNSKRWRQYKVNEWCGYYQWCDTVLQRRSLRCVNICLVVGRSVSQSVSQYLGHKPLTWVGRNLRVCQWRHIGSACQPDRKSVV